MSFITRSPKQLLKELEVANLKIKELELFRNIVEGANDGILIVQDGLIKYANQKLVDLTGYTIDEALETPVKRYIYSSALPEFMQRQEQRKVGISVLPIFETLIRDKKDNILRVEINFKEITYQGSKADLVCIRDLTERKKTEERLDTSLAFMDAAPDSFFLFDSKFRLIDINSTALLGFPEGSEKKDVLGMHLSDIVPGIEDTERYSKYLDVLETEMPIAIEEYAVPTRKGIQYFSSRAFKVQDGVGIITTEITGLKKTEAERKRAQEQLEKVKREEELYYSMQSHFIKNDLQRVLFLLESNLYQTASVKQKEANVEEVILTCHHISRTIDTVNKIFSVLQSKFEERKSERSLLKIIEEISYSIDIPIIIEREELELTVLLDDSFKDLLAEIIAFIRNWGGKLIQITRDRSIDDSEFYIITIKENMTTPLQEEVCKRISTGIEEEKWEFLGHHIGLTLASVITQYYGGKLIIQPQKGRGNYYHIYLPSSLVISYNKTL